MSSTREQAERSMSDSHELRNPMGQPRGSASEIPQGRSCLSRQEAASWLVSVGQMAARVIADVRNWSRCEVPWKTPVGWPDGSERK